MKSRVIEFGDDLMIPSQRMYGQCPVRLSLYVAKIATDVAVQLIDVVFQLYKCPVMSRRYDLCCGKAGATQIFDELMLCPQLAWFPKGRMPTSQEKPSRACFDLPIVIDTAVGDAAMVSYFAHIIVLQEFRQSFLLHLPLSPLAHLCAESGAAQQKYRNFALKQDVWFDSVNRETRQLLCEFQHRLLHARPARLVPFQQVVPSLQLNVR
jgi:hypothetical protein